MLDLCVGLNHTCNPDALIVGEDSFSGLFGAESSLVRLDMYDDSPFEAKRRYEAIEEIFIRAIRFAKHLRIYDKQIGKGTSLNHLYHGIDYILSLWSQHGIFLSAGVGQVEIYTCEKETVYPDNGKVQSAQVKVNEGIRLKIEQEVVNRLRRKYPWPISLHIKHDVDNDFHARHLEAQTVILLLERGFGFLKSDGSPKRTVIKLDNPAFEHLRAYRALPDSVRLSSITK